MRQGGLNQGFSKTFLFGDPLLKKFFLGDHLMGSLEVSDTWNCTIPGQCCQLVHIYAKFEKFGIFSKCLVYNFLIGIYEKFGIVLSEGLVEILIQFIWLITKRKQTNRQWC